METLLKGRDIAIMLETGINEEETIRIPNEYLEPA